MTPNEEAQPLRWGGGTGEGHRTSLEDAGRVVELARGDVGPFPATFGFAFSARMPMVVFEAIAASAGLAAPARGEPPDWLVTDRVDSGHPRVILVVVDLTPALAQTAVAAFLAGDVAAILLAEQASSLPEVVGLAQRRQASIPVAVLEAGARTPVLSARELDVLRVLTTGRSNRQIAARLHVSEATVKRDVARMLEMFGCATRLELGFLAQRMGYLDRPDGAGPAGPIGSRR